MIRVSDNDVVESFLPGEAGLPEIPPDPFCHVRLELANDYAQRLREEMLRLFGSRLVAWISMEDQNAVDVIGHDDPLVQTYPGMAARNLLPFLRNHLAHRR